MAAARDLVEHSLDWHEDGDPTGQYAGQVAGHAAAVGYPGGGDPAGVNAVTGLQRVQHVADEQPVVDVVRVRIAGAAVVPACREPAVALE
jgi:hypothetical protein